MAEPFTIELYPGETLFLELAFTDDDDAPIDLSGSTPSARASLPIDPANVIFDTTDAANGVITARVSGGITATWSAGKADFQIWLDNGALTDVQHEVSFDALVTIKETRAIP